MEAAGVEKSLIVQPILYLYDHSCTYLHSSTQTFFLLCLLSLTYTYTHTHTHIKTDVQQTIAEAPQKFKGMLNANPTLTPEAAVEEVQTLHKQGFGSIRYNPYIWPAGEKVYT